MYDRPMEGQATRRPGRMPATIVDAEEHLLTLLADTSWVWTQYDHQLFLNTVHGPGGDATVLRLKHPQTGEDTGRGLALTTDGNHRWCADDPRLGTAMVVAEAASNLACVGARPLALVNCLNFGNPEHPAVMWQLSEAIDGMSDACRALDVPVVGGNVSLYNETAGSDIAPTPVVGMLGVVDDLARRPPGPHVEPAARLAVIGPAELDLETHARVTSVVRALVASGRVVGAHDVADGGVAACVAEMAVASDCGVQVDSPTDAAGAFDEMPSRIVVSLRPNDAGEIERRCTDAAVPLTWIGVAGGDRIRIGDLIDLPLSVAIQRWRGRLPEAFGTAVTH
jgi:phosphoribosylformylglycinamidine synthase